MSLSADPTAHQQEQHEQQGQLMNQENSLLDQSSSSSRQHSSIHHNEHHEDTDIQHTSAAGDSTAGDATSPDIAAGPGSDSVGVNINSLPFVGQIEVKLFVGRLPTSSTEKSIETMFEPYGQVKQVQIIRDKITSVHKGSAFVCMKSITQADLAIRALHNRKAVDPSLGPVQISYAAKEAERLGFTPGAVVPGDSEAKLFVGSLPPNTTEQSFAEFFSKYGSSFDAYLMRDPVTRRFRGCGFIKFSYKEEALVAIKKLHGVVTLPGALRPLEVRIAEPKRSSGPGSALGPMQPQQENSRMGNMGGNPFLSFKQKPQQAQQIPPMYLMRTVQQQQPNVLSNENPRRFGFWKEYFDHEGRPYYHNDQTGVTQWEIPDPLFHTGAQRRMLGTSTDPTGAAADLSGPAGANIFVFHLPNEWRKEDLIAFFAPFGYILSARVAMDQTTTGSNKGYGFVSYDNIRSAIEAVNQMHGVQIRNKRLRVAIKSGEEEEARRHAEQHGILFNISGLASAGTAAGQGTAYSQNNNLQQGFGVFPGMLLQHQQQEFPSAASGASDAYFQPDQQQMRQRMVQEQQQQQAHLYRVGEDEMEGMQVGQRTQIGAAGAAVGRPRQQQANSISGSSGIMLPTIE